MLIAIFMGSCTSDEEDISPQPVIELNTEGDDDPSGSGGG